MLRGLFEVGTPGFMDAGRVFLPLIEHLLGVEIAGCFSLLIRAQVTGSSEIACDLRVEDEILNCTGGSSSQHDA